MASLGKETTAGARARNESLASVEPPRPFHLALLERHPSTTSPQSQDARPQAASGERLMARTFDRQTTELHIRAALLNRFTPLGTPETIRVA